MNFNLYKSKEGPFLSQVVNLEIGEKPSQEQIIGNSYILEAHLSPKIFLPFEASQIKNNKYGENYTNLNFLSSVRLSIERFAQSLEHTVQTQEMGGPFFYRRFFGEEQIGASYPVYIFNVLSKEGREITGKDVTRELYASFKKGYVHKRNDLVYVKEQQPSFAHAISISPTQYDDHVSTCVLFFDEASYQQYKKRTINDKLPFFQ